MKDRYVTVEEACRMLEEGKGYYLLSNICKRLGFYTKKRCRTYARTIKGEQR